MTLLPWAASLKKREIIWIKKSLKRTHYDHRVAIVTKLKKSAILAGNYESIGMCYLRKPNFGIIHVVATLCDI